MSQAKGVQQVTSMGMGLNIATTPTRMNQSGRYCLRQCMAETPSLLSYVLSTATVQAIEELMSRYEALSLLKDQLEKA